jgi:hypothetical protein
MFLENRMMPEPTSVYLSPERFSELETQLRKETAEGRRLGFTVGVDEIGRWIEPHAGTITFLEPGEQPPRLTVKYRLNPNPPSGGRGFVPATPPGPWRNDTNSLDHWNEIAARNSETGEVLVLGAMPMLETISSVDLHRAFHELGVAFRDELNRIHNARTDGTKG